MNERDLSYLQRCFDIASLSQDPRHKVGCLIVKGWCGKIMARGYNQMPKRMHDGEARWHIKEQKRSLVIHAEEDALLQLDVHSGLTLYSNYRPCLSCSRLIIHAGISRVVWYTSNPNYPTPAHMFDEAGVTYDWKEQS